MKTLVIANQKGGVGKTSTVVHLAFYFQEKGLKVAVIDCDIQGNASYTLQNHQVDYSTSQMFNGDLDTLNTTNVNGNGKNASICLIHADSGLADMEKRSLGEVAETFHAAMQILSDQGVDICLIDTPPSLGVSMAATLFSADFILSPIEMEAFSIQGIKKMVTTIANVKQHNRKLTFIGMVPSRVDARNPRHVRHKKELEKTYPDLLLPTTIGLRSSIADALASGIPVWKVKKTAARKAAQEIKALADHVSKVMEIQ